VRGGSAAQDLARYALPVEADVRGLEVSDAKRLRAIMEENPRLRQVVAEQALNIQMLKDVPGKEW